jgi:hypothetical protein
MSLVRFDVATDDAADNDEMPGARLWPKEAPILAASPRRKKAKDVALPKTNRRSAELVCVHTVHDEGRLISASPLFQAIVLKVRRLFIVPILVVRRIVLKRLPEIQSARDDAILPFDPPRALHMQREITGRTAIDRTQGAELERPHIGRTSRGGHLCALRLHA